VTHLPETSADEIILARSLLAPGASVTPDLAPAPADRIVCDRCRGRMLPEGKEGDMACFNCGHVLYAAPPMALIPAGRIRHPSTGGQSLG
jgi:hypothetical protein